MWEIRRRVGQLHHCLKCSVLCNRVITHFGLAVTLLDCFYGYFGRHLVCTCYRKCSISDTKSCHTFPSPKFTNLVKHILASIIAFRKCGSQAQTPWLNMFNLGFHFFTNLNFAEVWFGACISVWKWRNSPCPKVITVHLWLNQSLTEQTLGVLAKFESLSYEYLFSFLLQIMNYKREETS